jgi:hypothetical protein
MWEVSFMKLNFNSIAENIGKGIGRTAEQPQFLAAKGKGPTLPPQASQRAKDIIDIKFPGKGGGGDNGGGGGGTDPGDGINN